TCCAVRPRRNLLFPALSGLIDPLSPDHAARRAALESVPFFTGHGLALGLLLAIASAHGPRALAQVEVGPPTRRGPADRRAMAFAQLQVCLKYLGDQHRLQLVAQGHSTLKPHQYAAHRYWLAQ